MSETGTVIGKDIVQILWQSPKSCAMQKVLKCELERWKSAWKTKIIGEL